MAETFQLQVLTPTRKLFDARVESIVAPGIEGYVGILAHHAPLITALRPGRLTVRFAAEPAPVAAEAAGTAVRAAGETVEARTPTFAGTQIFCVSGGFLEVSGNRAIILADAIEAPREIDVERARRAAERARERIRAGSPEWDVDRAVAALERALSRLKVASEAAGR